MACASERAGEQNALKYLRGKKVRELNDGMLHRHLSVRATLVLCRWRTTVHLVDGLGRRSEAAKQRNSGRGHQLCRSIFEVAVKREDLFVNEHSLNISAKRCLAFGELFALLAGGRLGANEELHR